ncbi:MAG TPA: hypothetical protein ENJ39_07790 [Flammeovirgaceae bacterium]|nr:hypothetical protein [Flammeovirgaceae bacterium]
MQKKKYSALSIADFREKEKPRNAGLLLFTLLTEHKSAIILKAQPENTPVALLAGNQSQAF